MKLLFACVFTFYLLWKPEICMQSARESMALWANAVAPALFPFLALLPALSGACARALYGRVFGGFMRKVFRLPGEAAVPVMVGMIAGTPAGALSVERTGLRGREALTAGVLASGAGPVFLVCSVGAGMFLSVETGVKILFSVWAAHWITGFALSRLLLPKMVESGARESVLQPEEHDTILAAVRAVLGVCGWMVWFRVFTSELPPALRAWFEISAGCAYAAENAYPLLAACVCGLGGVCALFQNLSILRKAGVSAGAFFAAKLACAALSGASFALISGVRLPEARVSADAYACALFLALALLAGVVFSGFHKSGRYKMDT